MPAPHRFRLIDAALQPRPHLDDAHSSLQDALQTAIHRSRLLTFDAISVFCFSRLFLRQQGVRSLLVEVSPLNQVHPPCASMCQCNAHLTQKRGLRLVSGHLNVHWPLAELGAEEGIPLRCAFKCLARYRAGGFRFAGQRARHGDVAPLPQQRGPINAPEQVDTAAHRAVAKRGLVDELHPLGHRLAGCGVVGFGLFSGGR